MKTSFIRKVTNELFFTKRNHIYQSASLSRERYDLFKTIVESDHRHSILHHSKPQSTHFQLRIALGGRSIGSQKSPKIQQKSSETVKWLKWFPKWFQNG